MARRLRELIRELQPDLCHFITLRSMLHASLLAIFGPRNRSVVSVTGLGYLFTSTKPHVSVARNIIGLLLALGCRLGRYRFVFQNPDDLELFCSKGWVPKRETSVVLGSGIDPQEFAAGPLPPGAPVVMFAGRFLSHKGVEVFIEAVRRLKRDQQIARFVLVGAIDPKNPASVTQEQIESWRDEGFVELWGHSSDMAATLRQASVVTLPSYYREGVPKTLIEAASCGRAIVTTDAPGCREIVQHGVNGLLVRPKDPDDLASALSTLLDQPDLLAEMGKEGRKRVLSAFSNEIIVNQLLCEYARVCRNEPAVQA